MQKKLVLLLFFDNIWADGQLNVKFFWVILTSKTKLFSNPDLQQWLNHLISMLQSWICFHLYIVLVSVLENLEGCVDFGCYGHSREDFLYYKAISLALSPCYRENHNAGSKVNLSMFLSSPPHSFSSLPWAYLIKSSYLDPLSVDPQVFLWIILINQWAK